MFPEINRLSWRASGSEPSMCLHRCAVLYSYNPRRPEELELKKGEMVGVYGKFKEGWLRGLSLRTGRVGILPSNYISPVLRLDAGNVAATAGANWHDQIKYSSSVSLLPHCRTSARLLETRAANITSQHNSVTGKRPTAAKNPSVFLSLDPVNSETSVYSAGTVPSVPDGAQNSMSSISAGKPSLYGSTQGWDTVRRIFNPHRGED